jgi:hypothetical protein
MGGAATQVADRPEETSLPPCAALYRQVSDEDLVRKHLELFVGSCQTCISDEWVPRADHSATEAAFESVPNLEYQRWILVLVDRLLQSQNELLLLQPLARGDLSSELHWTVTNAGVELRLVAVSTARSWPAMQTHSEHWDVLRALCDVAEPQVCFEGSNRVVRCAVRPRFASPAAAAAAAAAAGGAELLPGTQRMLFRRALEVAACRRTFGVPLRAATFNGKGLDVRTSIAQLVQQTADGWEAVVECQDLVVLRRSLAQAAPSDANVSHLAWVNGGVWTYGGGTHAARARGLCKRRNLAAGSDRPPHFQVAVWARLAPGQCHFSDATLAVLVERSYFRTASPGSKARADNSSSSSSSH